MTWIKIERVTEEGVEPALYSRGEYLTKEEAQAQGLPEGKWLKAYKINEIPVYEGDIIRLGKRKFVKIV